MSPNVPGLFADLADLSPEERSRYYTDHAVDAGTRRELEELLAHDSVNVDTFSQLVGAATKAVLHGDLTGVRCGAFRLVDMLGTGGMGVVYLGERVDGEVTQRAAVKLMQPGWSQAQRERFLREREILAALTHPNIAHFLDAGHLKDGQPYLVMEYVEGKRIDEYCQALGPRHKIQLFLKICGAVEYLHANFVLHRDLKPSNILVTSSGEPKLLDFGVAKIVDLQGELTATQVRMLTPDYASPEQMRGGTVGPASDVYSLGAVLCLLLTGKTAAGDQLFGLPAGLDAGLTLVLQTAMQPDPEDRYRSVAAFADDLRACLDSRRIRARRRDWIYRARRFARRQPISAGLAGALLASLAVLGGLWYKQSQPASTLQNLTPARITSNTPELPIEAAAISPDGKVVAYADSLGIHFHYPATGETRLLPQTSGHVLVHWTQDGSGLQTQTLDADGRVAGAVISAVDGSVRSVGASDQYTMSPDGNRRVRLAKNPERIVVEDRDGANARDLWIARELSVNQFVWSPDSRNIALVSSDSAASTLETIDVTSGRRTIRIAPGMKLIIDALVWPNQDRLIVAVREQGRGVNSRGANNLWEVRLRDADQGSLRRLTAWTDFPIRFASMTTDGRKLTFIRSFRQRDVYVARFDPERLRMGTPRRLTLDLGDDYPTAWTPDSKAVLFTSDRNGPNAIFRQALDKQTADQIVFGPSNQIIARAAADGKWILFYGRDGAKRGIMRAPMDGGKAELLLASSNIIGLRCSRTGPCIISERRDGVVIVSEVDPLKGTRVREIYRDTSIRFAGPDLSPDARWLATPSGGRIVLRAFATGAVVREIAVQGASDTMNLVNLDYAADGKGFFAGQTTPTETRQLYVTLSGKTSVLWRQAGKSLLWGIPSPNGRYLAMMVYTDDSNVYTITDF